MKSTTAAAFAVVCAVALSSSVVAAPITDPSLVAKSDGAAPPPPPPAPAPAAPGAGSPSPPPPPPPGPPAGGPPPSPDSVLDGIPPPGFPPSNSPPRAITSGQGGGPPSLDLPADPDSPSFDPTAPSTAKLGFPLSAPGGDASDDDGDDDDDDTSIMDNAEIMNGLRHGIKEGLETALSQTLGLSSHDMVRDEEVTQVVHCIGPKVLNQMVSCVKEQNLLVQGVDDVAYGDEHSQAILSCIDPHALDRVESCISKLEVQRLGEDAHIFQQLYNESNLKGKEFALEHPNTPAPGVQLESPLQKATKPLFDTNWVDAYRDPDGPMYGGSSHPAKGHDDDLLSSQPPPPPSSSSSVSAGKDKSMGKTDKKDYGLDDDDEDDDEDEDDAAVGTTPPAFSMKPTNSTLPAAAKPDGGKADPNADPKTNAKPDTKTDDGDDKSDNEFDDDEYDDTYDDKYDDKFDDKSDGVPPPPPSAAPPKGKDDDKKDGAAAAAPPFVKRKYGYGSDWETAVGVRDKHPLPRRRDVVGMSNEA